MPVELGRRPIDYDDDSYYKRDIALVFFDEALLRFVDMFRARWVEF